MISWKANDPAGVEVRVSTSPGDEKLVARAGRSGEMEIPWVVSSSTHDVRLYAASQPDAPIDSVKVRRDLDSEPAALHELADEVMRGNINMTELSRFIAAIIPTCLQSAKVRELFQDWERHGFHVTPVHF